MTDEGECENQSFMKNNYFHYERVINNQFVGRYVKENSISFFSYLPHQHFFTYSLLWQQVEFPILHLPKTALTLP